jgi:uncharacterized membrane protein
MATVLEDRAEALDPRPESVTHPVTPVAGPEGHPFHPILVTIPIGAWVSSFLFDVASRVSDDPVTFGRGAIWLIWIGVAGAAAAALFGLLDLRTIPGGTPARSTALAHLSLNSAALVLWAVDGWARDANWKYPFETPWWGFALSAVALILISASGYLGGRLSYHYGVRVAGGRKQAEGYELHDADQPTLDLG